jgi:hypothetical protein
VSEFNNTEPDMDKLDSHTSKEAAWRSRLQRHAQSGKSIAAFCRDEAVSTASFHIWRAKLAAASGHAAQPAQPAAFIDLGAIKDAVGVTAMAHPSASTPVVTPGLRNAGTATASGQRVVVTFLATPPVVRTRTSSAIPPRREVDLAFSIPKLSGNDISFSITLGNEKPLAGFCLG